MQGGIQIRRRRPPPPPPFMRAKFGSRPAPSELETAQWEKKNHLYHCNLGAIAIAASSLNHNTHTQSVLSFSLSLLSLSSTRVVERESMWTGIEELNKTNQTHTTVCSERVEFGLARGYLYRGQTKAMWTRGGATLSWCDFTVHSTRNTLRKLVFVFLK